MNNLLTTIQDEIRNSGGWAVWRDSVLMENIMLLRWDERESVRKRFDYHKNRKIKKAA